MAAQHIEPHLVMADEQGNIYDDERLLMVCRRGAQWGLPRPDELMPLPEESELFLLPGRRAVGLNPETGDIEAVCKCRGIIYPVTNHHRDGFAGSCSGPDCGYLILREQFGVNLVNADFAGNDIGGSPLVTGKHGELGDAQLMQFGERCLGVGTRYVAQHNARDQLPSTDT